MQPALNKMYTWSLADEFSEKMAALNLRYYASEAAAEMMFDSPEELENSIKRGIELCVSAGIPIRGNFHRVYKSFDDGLKQDWKLSALAYHLVRLNGKSFNPNVARFTIQLIKENT